MTEVVDNQLTVHRRGECPRFVEVVRNGCLSPGTDSLTRLSDSTGKPLIVALILAFGSRARHAVSVC
jgi:hypothetical protein